MKEKTRLRKLYKQTEVEWLHSDLKYKKDKIRKYLEGIEIISKEQRYFIDNQFIMLEELDSPEIEEYLDTTHSIIMADNKAVIDNLC